MNSRKLLATSIALIITPAITLGSSHREAPQITDMPRVDGSDFYMFRSYEAGREDYVTFIANYLPLQDAYGGPNYFMLDEEAIYEIHIDNDGDAEEDLTFQFDFEAETRGITLPIGGEEVAIPLRQAGQVGPGADDDQALNVLESYSLKVTTGDRRTGMSRTITNAFTGSNSFKKPIDNFGNKTITDYASYANSHIHEINIPGCGNGRVFVGQRKEGFAVNLGEIFDLINTDPLGAPNGEANTLEDKNVTSLAIEVPIDCLTTGGSSIIGAWTTASVRQAQLVNPSPVQRGAVIKGGAYTQVSRLGSPLVNEVVIGLPDKDLFNHSEPKDDAQFATYVTNPTLPALIELLFPAATAPTAFPRTDLVAAFLTGVDGLNQPAGVVASEMLRLNTDIAPAPAAGQLPLAVLAGDTAGFPNGRRPGDDVVDIALRVAMGVLLDMSDAMAGQLPYTDGAYVDASYFDETFPYLTTPVPGSPN